MSDDIVDIVDIIDLKPSLLRDLKNLYKNLEKDNNNDYNVIIKVDQKNFKAHSVILKLRSEYFHNLINNELAKKMVKFKKNPNWLKRRHSMGKQPPGLQRKNTLAKPPVVVQPRIRTVSKIINNQKIKRISRWIDGNESNELGDSNNNHD
ncbi:14990_t:CDS:2 [Rhizophagus irregularis]|nr:14990_t:CDS:2 [Rhizophagus irregularis]